MTEMNELTRSLVRVEELINGKQYQGALTCLEYVKNHALTAVKLIKDQAALLTKQQLEIITLIKDVEIQKERADMQYKRAVSAEAEINELDEQKPCRYIGYGKQLSYPDDIYLGDPDWMPVYARPVPAKRVHENSNQLYKFYQVANDADLFRELIKHIDLLQDSAKRNVKPWEDTFPPTLLPSYIEKIMKADFEVNNGE